MIYYNQGGGWYTQTVYYWTFSFKTNESVTDTETGFRAPFMLYQVDAFLDGKLIPLLVENYIKNCIISA